MLTLSDFRAARSCPTKLFHRRRGYPTTQEYADITALLAEQRAAIATAARERYPHGRAIAPELSLEVRLATTAEALAIPGDVTLFDAAVGGDGLLAEVAVLIKQGEIVRLLAVSSRGVRAEPAHSTAGTLATRPRLRAEWRPLLEELAFQCLAVTSQWPELTVHSSVIAPLNMAVTPDDTLLELDVTAEVTALLPEVVATVSRLQSPDADPIQGGAHLGAHCRACEYRTTAQPSGFAACWGEPGVGGDHLLDLVSLNTLPGDVLDDLIASGNTSLRTLPEAVLGPGRWSGTGSVRERQRRQVRQTQLGAPIMDPALPDIVGRLPYPLHFIDFETISPAVPRHAGLQPFEVVAFQWSCHTVPGPDRAPVHAAWLQHEAGDPSPAFAAALRAQVGDEGTILVWSNHERSVLQAIRQRLGSGPNPGDAGLTAWLDRTTTGGRIADLQRLAARHYYHPLMGGKTTVKAVLGAVWAADAALRERYPEFAAENGALENPYRQLPSRRVNGQERAVRNGAGAALAYLRLLGNGTAPPPDEQAGWRALLEQYCRLDTLAMVMIWEHWRS